MGRPMTHAEFARIIGPGPNRKPLRMGPVTLAMARRILCDGISVADAAREAGRTKQQASSAAQRVRRRALDETVCPTCHRPL